MRMRNELELIKEHSLLYLEYDDKCKKMKEYINENIDSDYYHLDYDKYARKLKGRKKKEFQKMDKERKAILKKMEKIGKKLDDKYLSYAGNTINIISLEKFFRIVIKDELEKVKLVSEMSSGIEKFVDSVFVDFLENDLVVNDLGEQWLNVSVINDKGIKFFVNSEFVNTFDCSKDFPGFIEGSKWYNVCIKNDEGKNSFFVNGKFKFNK